MRISLSLLFKVFIFILPVIFLSSCKEDEEPEDTLGVSADFDLIGTWNFEQVAGEGVIFGAPTEATDNMPTGFVRFDEGGTGFSEFSINLLNLDYGKEETFTWTRLSEDQVELRQSDGETDTWTLIRANNNLIEASWLIVRVGAEATLTATLTP